MSLLPTISRPHLIDELSDASARVVKLIAPAGYGKSTLVNEWMKTVPSFARIDLERVVTAGDITRRLVTSIGALQPAPVRSDLPDRMVGLGDDDRAWEQLAGRLIEEAPPETVLHLENAEAIHDQPELLHVLEGLVTQLPSGARIIVCSRVNILRFGRFAGPDRSRVLAARDLRLTSDEIGELFTSLRISSADIASIERFTQGWPIVVMMLFTLARRGRLSAYLTEREDVSDLYGYLATEVFSALPELHARVLEALTAIPDAREDELALLFPGEDIPKTVRFLQSETPFVSKSGATIDLHPAMREMLAARCDVDVYRARLFDRVSRGDGGERAARIALLRNRPNDAGRAIMEGGLHGDWWTPAFAEVFSELPESVFAEYPALWAHASWIRSCHDAVATTHMGRRLLAGLADDAPAPLRIGLMSSIIQLLANRGHLDDAQELTDRFGSHPVFAENTTARMLQAFFAQVIALYRGDPVDIVEFQSRFSDLFLTSPVQQALRDACLIAPYYRLHGNYDLERAAMQRGSEIARGTGLPMMGIVSGIYGAMSAWFWGDEELFDAYVAEAEASATPSLAGAAAHFIDCVRGRGLAAKPGSEKLDMRTYAYAIAASRARNDQDRLQLAEAALVAAQQSSQRFGEVVARVVLAFCDASRRDGHLDRAATLAREMQSPVLTLAVAALRQGNADGTMLGPLAARFAREQSTSGDNAWTLDLFESAISRGVERATLAPRECELLAYLALQSAPVDGAVVAAALWPDSEEERRSLNLRVTANRVRRRLREPRIIVADSTGYALGVAVDLKPISEKFLKCVRDSDAREVARMLDAWPPATVAGWSWRAQLDEKLPVARRSSESRWGTLIGS